MFANAVGLWQEMTLNYELFCCSSFLSLSTSKMSASSLSHNADVKGSSY